MEKVFFLVFSLRALRRQKGENARVGIACQWQERGNRRYKGRTERFVDVEVREDVVVKIHIFQKELFLETNVDFRVGLGCLLFFLNVLKDARTCFYQTFIGRFEEGQAVIMLELLGSKPPQTGPRKEPLYRRLARTCFKGKRWEIALVFRDDQGSITGPTCHIIFVAFAAEHLLTTGCSVRFCQEIFEDHKFAAGTEQELSLSFLGRRVTPEFFHIKKAILPWKMEGT